MKNQRLEVRVQRFGFTLIEMLISVVLLSTVAIISTQALSYSLRGNRKSEIKLLVNDEVGYAMGVMERVLRSAKELKNCADPPFPSDTLEFLDSQSGEYYYFSCNAGGYLETNYDVAAVTKITGTGVIITNCSKMFSCDSTKTPHSVDISVEAESVEGGAEGGKIETSTKILLRNYE